jgi:acyl carrier protein
MPDQTASRSINQQDTLQGGVIAVLASTLGLPVTSIDAHPDTRVLGVIPELDSMSVMTFLINLEEAYDIVIFDDEVDAAIFQTIGSLTNFLRTKLGD